MKHLCPTCRQQVACVPSNLTIRAHVDTLGYELCPSSREPFYTTLLADPELQLHASRRSA